MYYPYYNPTKILRDAYLKEFKGNIKCAIKDIKVLDVMSWSVDYPEIAEEYLNQGLANLQGNV